MSNYVVVELDPVELGTAIYAGDLLYQESKAAHFTDRTRSRTMNALDITRMGQVGERAVAKALGLYWSSARFTFSLPDLAHRVEVRSTLGRVGGMKVTMKDADDKRVVSVLMPKGYTTPPFTIMGWLEAGKAKLQAWWKEDRWVVPWSELRPLAELQRLIEEERLHGTAAV